MVSALRMPFQALVRPVGFDRFGLLSVATRYRTLSADCSLGKWPRWRTALRNRALRLSMALVVYTIVLSSTGNARNGVKSAQARSQVSIIAGYLVRHCSANSAKRAWAASTGGGGENFRISPQTS